jgi:hypothetical protein
VNIPIRFVPLVLLLVTILAYGIFAPWLGYYGDDWPGIYNLVTGGLWAMVDSQSLDRPIWGWISGIEYQFIGDRPIGWHIYAALTRYASALALWFLCRQIWPKHQIEAAAVTLLFLVYPGILQESRGFTYGTIWLQLALSILSLVLMAKSIRIKKTYKIVVIPLALLSAGVSWNISEYFFGFELLRPFILWIVVADQSKSLVDRTLRTVKTWLVYLGALLGYIVYRFSIFDTKRTEVDPSHFLSEILADPVTEVAQRLNFVIPDLIETSLLVWANTLSSGNLSITSRSTWLAWTIGAVVSALVFFLLVNLSSNLDDRSERIQKKIIDWPLVAIIGGLVTTIFGMLPIWFSNVHYVQDTGASRYALPAIIGASLVLVGLLQLVVWNPRKFIICVSVLTGMGTAAHIKSENSYRHEWADQKQLLSQLTWRIPSLETGTVVWLQSDVWRERHPGAYTYAMPLNLTYAPRNKSSDLSFWLLPLEERFEQVELSKIHQARLIYRGRNLSFNGSLNRNIVVWHSPPSCLRVLDKNSQLPPTINRWVDVARTYSNMDLIIDDPKITRRLPESIFGREAESDWCYYFEKAELAEQYGDWELVAEFADEVRRKGLSPSDATEWRPFIEGYKKMGRGTDARLLSRKH